MPAPAQGPGIGFTQNRRIGAAKVHEVATIEDFTLGYRNREDTSLLKPQTLVAGSHDVLMDVSGRVNSRQGYILDGAPSTVLAPARSPFKWETQTGFIHNLRACLLTDQIVTISIANPAVFTTVNPHGYTAGTALSFQTTGTLPTGLAPATTYYVISAGLTSNSFEVSATFGGTAIATTGSQSGIQTIGDGQLQIRYKDSAGNVSWLMLLGGLSSTLFNYTNYWDSTDVRALLLMVNGSQGIWEWSGGIGTVASFSTGSITVNGTQTLAQLGFYPSGNIIVGGVNYAYTSISGQTFQGVTSFPSGISANAPVYQAPIFTTVGSMTFTITPNPPAGFTFDLISQLNNQVFFGSVSSNLLYMSKAGTYKDYSQSTARLQYEGDQFTTQGPLRALIQEDQALYISAGIDEWYLTDFVDTTITDQNTGTTQTFEDALLQRIKTTAGQASQSQAMTAKIKNSIVFVSNEPILNSFGQVANYLQQPVVDDLSYAIVDDILNYDFTDASVFYNNQFIFLAVPKEGLFRMYNMTNPKNPYWEAPITIPLSGFSSDGTTVIGHSYLSSESYQLFSGYSDRAANLNSVGNPIACSAVFAFQNDGLRAKRKSFNKFFVEGYMNTNTSITTNLISRSPSNGITPSASFTVQGNQPYVLQQPDNSLGKFSFGKAPLGTDSIIAQQNTLPNYFAVFKTFTRFPYLAYQPVFSSYGVNQQWSLLSFGNNASPTSEGETDITI